MIFLNIHNKPNSYYIYSVIIFPILLKFIYIAIFFQRLYFTSFFINIPPFSIPIGRYPIKLFTYTSYINYGFTIFIIKRPACWAGLFRCVLSTKVIVHYVFIWNTQVVKHLGDSRDHHRRAAQIVFDVFRTFVIFEIVLENHLVDESG